MPMFYVPFVVAASDGAGSTAFDISEVMTKAVTSVQGDLLKVLAIAVAAAAVIYGAVVGVRFGLKWLKSLGKA
ncbi:hypothetical protein [Waltera sp.]|jgi:hypothetical protein|uniref:hypothetical protein n=1 Tax=Waltera sp. TaxID=2815806 RepID=UPI0030775A44